MASPLWSDHHHDPNYLWPISAIAAFSLHAVVGLWMVQARAAHSTLEPAIIEVIAIPVTAPPESSVDGPPSTTPNFDQPASEPTAIGNPEPTAAIPPESVSPPATATVEPPSIVPEVPPPRQSPVPSQVASPTLPAPSPTASAPIEPTEPGLQTWWTLRPLPQGRDIPEIFPRLPEGWQAPYLSVSRDNCVPGQDWTTWGSLTVELRLIVEADGRISQIQPFASSGNLAYDEAMRCVLERLNPVLEPASTSGEPIASDVLLEITGSPRL